MKLAVKKLDGKADGDVTLNKDVFGIEVREDILHRAVTYQLNKRRAGTHKTKDVSEVKGTGKKPHAQKGTGRARAGTLKTPIHRGGGVAFGPVVRSHATSLPKKVRIHALKTVLSSKAKNGKLVILSEAKAKTHKTKDMAKALSGLDLSSAIVFDKELDENFVRGAANIPLIDVLPTKALNVYDIMRRDVLVLTKEALTEIEARLSK